MKRMIRTMIAAGAAAMLLTAETGAAATVPAVQNKPYTTKDTLYAVGSVSKMFVTAAAMQLSDQGKLDLDAPVTEYLPEFTMQDSRYRKITPRMLMNHTSGLMGSYYSNSMLFADISAENHDDLLKHLSRERLKADPGAFGAYCNDGFNVLELIVERISGESFTDYVEQHIAKPLGMKQTGTHWNAFETPEQAVNRSQGAVYPFEYCMTIGDGGILSTAAEIARFGSAFFAGNTDLLSDSAKQEMQTCITEDKYEDGFGLGWDSVSEPDYDAAGVTVLSKGGDMSYQHAELLVAPDQEISISVLTSGGGSNTNKMFAKKLLDLALAEKGVSVTHEMPEIPQMLSEVPEQYLQYEGLYAHSGLMQVSFPNRKYMEVRSLERQNSIQRFLYTDSGAFIGVEGNPETGKTTVPDSVELISFTERDGCVYMCLDYSEDMGAFGVEKSSGYYAQKIEEQPVSAAVQKAWEQRDGKRYYVINERYSGCMYEQEPTKLQLYPDAKGYVSGRRIVDETHAEAILHVPSSTSRDQSDLVIRQENGAEILEVTDMGIQMIAEDAIPDLPADLTEVKLTTGAASWYNITGSASRNVTLDIPEHCAVYLYDDYGKILYSSFMKNYGNSVYLPEKCKIVFVGETGKTIGIS